MVQEEGLASDREPRQPSANSVTLARSSIPRAWVSFLPPSLPARIVTLGFQGYKVSGFSKGACDGEHPMQPVETS